MNRSVTAEKPWPKYPPTFERSIVTSLFRGFCLHYYSSRLSLYFLPSYTTWHFVFRCEDHSHNIRELTSPKMSSVFLSGISFVCLFASWRLVTAAENARRPWFHFHFQWRSLKVPYTDLTDVKHRRSLRGRRKSARGGRRKLEGLFQPNRAILWNLIHTYRYQICQKSRRIGCVIPLCK